MARVIPLTKGYTALVSNRDYARVSQFKWHVVLSKGHPYATRKLSRIDGKQPVQSMHRFILGLVQGDPREGDHKNRVRLDNRRSNLRITLNQNAQNQGKQKLNTSGFKGVSLHKATAKNRRLTDTWQAQISNKGKVIYLGYFPTRELAAQAYDAAALEKHGKFAVTNLILGLLKG
jgi:hypothetical protein